MTIAMQNEEPTLGDVLEAVNKGFTGVQAQIVALTQEIGKTNGRINVLIDVLHVNGALTPDQRTVIQAA